MSKRNWDRIKNQKPTDTLQYRDVYEDQQLERSDLDKRQTMTSRTILSLCVGLLTCLLVWISVTAIQMAFSGKGTLETNPSPENTWVYVNEHYVNVNDSTDVISAEAFTQLEQLHDDILSGKVSEVENPGEEPNLNASRGFKETDYLREHEGYYLTVPVGALMPDGSRCTQSTEMFISMDEYKAYAPKVTADYQDRLTAYKEYQRAVDEPANTYKEQVAHYRNRNDVTQYIKVEEYNQLMSEFETKKAKAKAGSKFAESCEVPLQPVDPATLYAEYEHGFVDPYLYSPTLYLSSEEQTAFTDFVSAHKVSAESENAQFRTLNDTVAFDSAPPESLTAVFEKLNTLVGDRAISYKNKLDGQVLTYQEYDALSYTYSEDIAAFKTAYQTHRESFHPNDIDGKVKVFDMAPNTVKVSLSLLLGLLVFAVLEAVLYANLRAQNVMSDTTDINQYKNDQHIALPEEIQRKYDIFPDVGAHSAVQVSSMISHMALMNKGLKNIDFAMRADKDMKDENGDVIYHKGEILEDDSGQPMSTKVPIIDTEFMESLFDASGVPKDKNIRKYYDATKIPYNPDGSNRDKLGKYDTWADVINEDWEFPLYEPQRPAGVYIIDTAPVNTMVWQCMRFFLSQMHNVLPI